MYEKLKRLGERAVSALSVIGLLLAPLLYFMLKRKSAKVADLQSKAEVTDAENKVALEQQKVDYSSADYERLRNEYRERIRKGSDLNGK